MLDASVLDLFADALVVVDAVDGRVVAWNRGAEQLLGHTAAEAIGRPWAELVCPAAQAQAQWATLCSVADGESGFEARRRHRDGREVAVAVTVRAIRDASGRVSQYGLVERALSVVSTPSGPTSIEARFADFLEVAPDAIVIVDSQGTIVSVNAQAERMFGYDRSELHGQPIECLVPSRDRARHVDHRGGFFADPRTREMGSGLALHAVRKDGSEFPVEISLGPLETGGRRLVASAIRDVTARRETDHALKLAYKELEAFSYSVAHDLRAPLRGLSGFSQVLLSEYHDKLGEDGLDCLNEIRSNALRMGELIDALLSLSRVSRSELRREPIDLGAIARTIARRLATQESGREVEVVIAEGLWVSADPTLARALLENLFDNAWKFTRGVATPRVEVGRTTRDGAPAYFVQDNGAGFDLAHAARLFTPFARLHTEREFPGTGIGLATVQRIVQRHGGVAWAQSEPGRGARFLFTLPGDLRGGPR